ncbi:DUF1430 domain-containing protein [Trueperella pyogenes]|uniref:bacteriocin-associated integral membrane family protein n=1 Tax=Trueperella pyogenes TaxID=1661 RepID=UPI000F85265B|nr:DUF1430 domain-containing protein [Trueperella pyogenes]AZR01387.1 DUF1430 domain-containing protein [Trueperella pyogenes]AZR02638.1 DUF1430 domain-containing protein [Trueperella pyogenes]
MHRLTRFFILLSVFIFFITAQTALTVLDGDMPYGTRSIFTISRVDTATKADAISAVSNIAKKNKVNIVKIQPKLEDAAFSRILYVFKGDEDAYEEIYGAGYPDFSPDTGSVEIRDASQLTTEDIRGKYAISGGNVSVDEIVSDLNAAHLVAESIYSALIIVDLGLLAIGRTHLAGVIAIVLVTLVLLVSYGVSQQKKIYAVRKIHGHSKRSNLLYSLSQILRDFIVAVLVIFVGGSCYLYVRNGFAQFARFWLICSAWLVFLAAFITVVTVCAVILFGSVNVPRAIKGEKDVVKVGVLSAVVQVAVIVIVTAVLNSSIARIAALNDALKADAVWHEGEPLYKINLSLTGTREDDLAVAPLFADMVGALENDGKVLLVFQDSQFAGLPSPYYFGAEKSLVVNNNYLGRQNIVDTTGKRLSQLPEEKDTFFLLIPENYPGDAEQLGNEYSEYLSHSCRFDVEDKSLGCSPRVNIIRTKAGQTLPTYGKTKDMPVDDQRPALVEDPVVAVVSAKSELLGPMIYLSYSSTENLLFEDVNTLKARLIQKDILSHFQGIDNAADAVARSVQLTRQQISLDILSMILASIAFVVSTFILAMVYCDRNKKMIFVRKIHGFRYYARHRAYIYMCAALCALSAAAAVAIYHPNLLMDSMRAGIVAAIALGIALGVLTVYEKRMQADYIKRD